MAGPARASRGKWRAPAPAKAGGPARGARSPAAPAVSGRWWRWVRHPLRAFSMGVAALALSWGVGSTSGTTLAIIGAVCGVVVGELLARSRLRLWAIVGVLGATLLGVVYGARLVTGTEFVAATLGTRAALGLGVVLRFAALGLVPTAVLRALAVRIRGLVALELAVVVGALAVMFAAHRDGIIARPLWLSDWAWRAGLEPVHVLLGIGAVTVVMLTLIMVAENGRRVSATSGLALPALAILALTFLNVGNLPKPNAANDLGLTQSSKGEPPRQTQQGGDNAPGGKDQQSSGQGNQQQTGQGQGQGQQQDTSGQGQQPQTSGQGQGQGQQQQQGQQGQQGQQQQQQGQQGQQGQQQQGQQGQQQQPDQNDQPSSSPEAKQAPMAIVTLHDDYSPPSQMFYFRQDVWSEYNGSRLVTPMRSDVDRDIIGQYPTQPTDVADPPPKTGRSLIHADVSMLVEHKAPFFLETAMRFVPMPNPNRQRFVRAYRFESMSQAIDYRELVGHKAGNPAWKPEVSRYYTTGPTDPRYGALARQILGSLPEKQRNDPFLKALAVKLYMDKEFIYSTKERHAGVADPTADFLFGNKTGYCVHFAHAAVYLWRSLGIPARAGTGYATTEDDRLGSTILIRSGDAHSWPEMYLEGIGWIILDISAQRNLDPPTPPPDKDEIRKLAEQNKQDTPQQQEEQGEDQTPRHRITASSVALGVLLAAVALGLVLYGIKLWRRIAARFASARTIPRLGYRLALDLLGEAGLTRRFGETRGRFAARVAETVPSFTKITDMNVAARFADPKVPLGERPEYSLASWRGELGTFRRELRQHSKLWRRLLGLLDPASFFASR